MSGNGHQHDQRNFQSSYFLSNKSLNTDTQKIKARELLMLARMI
jgi:hypothetical protein